MPAAGASSRMGGRDKLMELVDGVPLLARQAERAARTGAPVYVTTRGDRPARIAALTGLDVALVAVAEPEQGLSASIRAGTAALPDDVTALMVVLPDLPDIDTSDMHAMIAANLAAPDAILRATSQDGRPGHPTVFPRRYFDALTRLTGDAGAGPLIRQEGFTPVPLPGRRAITDLDTPEDWVHWRAGRKKET
ncbi:CTP--molybdopterin cytidylyltransferase [Pelagivirga sediminicola]|uniref:CTP--molybdopterin cytidylyltransferase n=1 Tax=Pelagivirga sediminicola TaxID=2170575 RepID=A0A2T7GCC6_9RHOB|nr:nucleotidyltransferase family protein [Pelagivirga sediminicola]PVA12028.1 CTP--molybdopterin cytidylyltransferase [Pelagivirga sediminicola]